MRFRTGCLPQCPQPKHDVNRVLIALLIVAITGGLAMSRLPGDATSVAPITLEPAVAIGVRVDTSLIGGYAVGRFADAVQALDSDLSAEERTLLGRHLDEIFSAQLGSEALERPGRLRIAYERAQRPDGSTRSIQVLGAELAANGRMYTFFHYEDGEASGYFDPYGVPINASAWTPPLERLRVTSRFGRSRMHPILRRVLPHTGVDLAAPRGELVRAPADGIVVSAGSNGGYGLMVELRHPNGYTTRYAHLNEIDPGVSIARIVRRGDRIGRVGMTGRATGPHLHYEVRRRGQPIDPMSLDARANLGSRVQAGAEWSQQQRLVTTLLARTPTMNAGPGY